MCRIFAITATSLFSLCLSLVAIYVIFRSRFLRRLRRHSGFSGSYTAAEAAIQFLTPPSDDADLQTLRDTHGIQAIAGDGTDEDRAVRVMHWVHALTKRSFNPPTPEVMTAMNLIYVCRNEGLRFNCWMYATVLNECLLSLGIISRLIHLSPPKEHPKESHFVNAVYLQDENRWIMLDPDMRGWFVNESGKRLEIHQIRERLISGAHLEANADVAIQGVNWLPNFVRKAIYKAYISKNIFRMASSRKSSVGIASQQTGRVTYELIPDDYHPEWLIEQKVSPKGNVHVYTNNIASFWEVASIGRESE